MDGELLEIQIIIKNQFGEFFGKKAIVNEEGYSKIIEISREFYKSSGFELTCEDGDFIVFPLEVVQNSMLRIICNKIKKEKE